MNKEIAERECNRQIVWYKRTNVICYICCYTACFALLLQESVHSSLLNIFLVSLCCLFIVPFVIMAITTVALFINLNRITIELLQSEEEDDYDEL